MGNAFRDCFQPKSVESNNHSNECKEIELLDEEHFFSSETDLNDFPRSTSTVELIPKHPPESSV